MKKLIIGMFAVASFVFCASAQETARMKQHKYRHGKTMMMKELNLTADQKEQVQASRRNTKNQLAALNKNEDITVREYKDRKKAILRSQKEELDRVLTTEQKKQLAQNKSERLTKRESTASKRLDRMKVRLNLSDDQLTKIKANQEAGNARARGIRENNQLSKTEKKEQLMALKQGQKDSFKQLLTAEQINQMEEMKKDRRENKSRK